MIQLANAPVSYGVFGLSRPDVVPLPDGATLAGWVEEAGYAGVDLGPIGLFGDADTLPDLLAHHRLGLAGGWVDLPLGAGTDEEVDAAMAVLVDALTIFAAAARTLPGPTPRPTLADSGSAERSARPGGGVDLELDPGLWRRFVDRLAVAASAVREVGLEPTFHPHACTYVETPREIERFLADTDVDITFDTGHLIIGGGDPVRDVQRWLPRINQIHLKDVDRTVLAAAAGSADPLRDVWERRVFTALGTGDLDVDGILEAILASGYSGWLVVEQDVILLDAGDVERARADQAANRELLRRWFP